MRWDVFVMFTLGSLVRKATWELMLWTIRRCLRGKSRKA
jgi:hypothetical protein